MNTRIWWAVYAIFGAWCVYRLVATVPQPLDSAGTLRPLLYDIFDRYLDLFDRRESAFAWWRAIGYLALLAPSVLAVLNYVRGGIWRSRRLFFGSIVVCLVLCRFPTLLQNEFNPDEGQFLASADKLFYDPNFFHAVDCGTSGPLNIYPLMLPAIVGLSPDFASSRMMVLAIILLSAFLIYRSVALLSGDALARVAVLPFVGTFAVFRLTELIHYSSEHVPLLLISAGLYASVRVLHDPARYSGALFTLGLLVSAAFFAKMQSVPVVGMEAGVALACVYARASAGPLWRPLFLLAMGGLPLPLLNAVLCAWAGVWSDFWMSYIRANSSYAERDTSFLENVRAFVQYVFAPQEVSCFLYLILAIGAAYILGQRFKRAKSAAGGPLGWFGALAWLTFGAAVFAVYIAHHLFFHYLLFLFVPLCAGVAWMLMRQKATPFITLVAALAAAYQVYVWRFQDDGAFKNAAATIRPEEGEFIRTMTSARGRIFVWGWTVRPYLGSGRVASTRDTNVSNCFRAYNLLTWPPVVSWTPASREISAYYVKRIARDLRADPPEVFIDAIGPTSWFLADPKYYGFEQFPEIASFVKSKYKLLTSYNYQRYYVRRDRAE